MICPTCGADGPVVRGATREATVGTVAAVCDAAPIVACPSGHGLPPAVAGPVVASCWSTLPRATPRRFGRTDRCGHCAARLTMPVRRTERPVTVADVPSLPVTTIRFDLPVTRCAECGVDQVPTRSVDDVTATVRSLFSSPG